MSSIAFLLRALLPLLAAICSCEQQQPAAAAGDDYPAARRAMVEQQIAARGVKDQRVLDAMRKVERHRFVPATQRHFAYADGPLAIGEGQTISQPYIVAFMTEALRLPPNARVLEIGTGSGYHAAVLAEIAKEVYTIEIVPSLGLQARQRLAKLGYRNVHVRVGDGYGGWPEKAPFEAVILTAAPPEIPAPLIDQLQRGGVLVAPVGRGLQQLVRLTKTSRGIKRETLLPVRFVPMTGKAQD